MIQHHIFEQPNEMTHVKKVERLRLANNSNINEVDL